MIPFFLSLYRFFSSLKLSVYLLGFALVLVFFGTLDQVHFGIYETQKRYFQSVIAFWHYPAEWSMGEWLSVLVVPMPGGYLIGPLFFINLLAAHFKYFKWRWKSLGIVMIHGGFVILLLGQLLTDLMQQEFQMWIDEGASSQYATSPLKNEFVIIETTDAKVNGVLSVPTESMKTGDVFQHEAFPFQVRIQQFYLNAQIMRLKEGQREGWVQTSHGVGKNMKLGIFEAAPTYRQNERNATTAVVELFAGSERIGNWIVSNVFSGQVPNQTFEYKGRSFEVDLRYLRKYFPFDIHLNDFTHDRYEGTDIPKNFSSQVVVRNPQTNDEREALIYMNHPLRYGGYTFYQASFGKGDTASMLQVVRNPGWLIPYISCLLMSLGFVYQFGWSIIVFAGRNKK